MLTEYKSVKRWMPASRAPTSPFNLVYRGTESERFRENFLNLRKRKATEEITVESLQSCPVTHCHRVLLTSVTYTQCSPVCGRQSLYKVNNNRPCWGHSLPIFELPLFAVPLQRPGEADYKSCHFPEITAT